MRTELTREGYQKKFNQQIKTFDYELQEGEVFKQCKEPYPSYWFVSNMGCVISVYANIRKLKANFRKNGKANKNGDRAGKNWYYEYKFPGEKHNRHIMMHQLVAEHFLENEFESNEEEDTHHIIPKNQFAENEESECNKAENLQRLPKPVHRELTAYAKKPAEKIEAEMDQQAKEDNAEVIELPQAQLTEQMVALANTLIQQGVDCRVYLVRDSDQAAAAYPVGGIVNHVDAEGKVTQRFITPKELARLDGKDSPLAGEQKEPDPKETESEDQEEQKEA